MWKDLKWYGEGRVIMPNKITTDMSGVSASPAGSTPCPPTSAPMDVAGIKVVGGYDGNKALGLPYIKANVLITDSKTGILRALISGDHINDLRTGAQPAVMARLLAAKTDVVTIIGTGLQGYMSLLCMSKVLDMKEIRVCDISEAAMDRFIARFPDARSASSSARATKGLPRPPMSSSPSPTPTRIWSKSRVKPGALVATMGSFRETRSTSSARRTASPSTRSASRCTAATSGAGGDGRDHGRLLRYHRAPDVLAGKMPGRTDPNHRIYARRSSAPVCAGRRAGGRAAGKAARGQGAAARV